MSSNATPDPTSRSRRTTTTTTSNAPTTTTAAGTSASPQAAGHALRPRRAAKNAYVISDSDSESKSPLYEDVSDSEPDADGDADAADAQPEEPEPERGTGTGKSLRPRRSLAAPEGLRDYVDTNTALAKRRTVATKKKKKVVHKKRRVGTNNGGRACQACRDARRRCDRKRPVCGGCVKAGKKCVVPADGEGGDDDEEGEEWEEVEQEVTTRGEIRREVEETKKRKDAFLVEYRGLFEALLPERNYISKLVEKRAAAKVKAEEVKTEDDAVKKDEDTHMKDEELKQEDVKGEITVKPESSGAQLETVELEMRDAPPLVENVKQEKEEYKVVPYQLLEKQPEG